jgi:DNA polymerase-3 subunit delta'
MIPIHFSDLKGNAAIKTFLTQMVSQRAIGNSLLFVGQEGIGKGLFAQTLAAEVMRMEAGDGRHDVKIAKGEHPDVHFYYPEGKLGLHSLQSLRQLAEEVQYPPYEAPWKVFIIHEAERMLSTSANALLKTFEEPPPRTLIILLSQSERELLPTITSRCRTLYFSPLSAKEIEGWLIEQGYEPTLSCTLSKLAEGSLARALCLARQGGDSNRTALLNALASLPLPGYKPLKELAAAIAGQIEVSKKQAEEEAKGSLNGDTLSAAQQQSLEKEIEGLSSLMMMREAKALFSQILSWYRDLHLLLIAPHSPYLMNADYRERLEQIVQNGHLVPFSFVQKAIVEAELALQRSTSLSLCLENLFIKLHLI